MDTNTPDETSVNESPRQDVVLQASAEQITNVQDVVIDPADPAHPDHPEHHKHMSALAAASVSHSAVNRVMPHHRGIDL